MDTPDNIPQVRRDVLYAERYKKAEFVGELAGKRWCAERERYYSHADFPIADAVAERITPHFMPAPWSQFKSSAKGKFHMYYALELCIIEILEKGGGAEGTQYVIDRQDGTQYSHPPCALPVFTYGEGDQKVIHYAMHLAERTAGRIAIRSGDWDVPLSLMGFNHERIDVVIASVFVSADEPDEDRPVDPFEKARTVEMVRKSAVARWASKYKKMYEIIDTSRMQRYTPTARVNFVFWALCGGGADYCKHGTRKFGYTEKPARELAHEALSGRGKPCVEFVMDPLNPMGRTLRFHPVRFVEQLCRLKRGPQRNESVAAFSSAVHYMLFQLRYYFGCDSQRTPAGPLHPQVDVPLFEGCSTVSHMMSSPGRLDERPVDFHEDYPWTADMVRPYADMVRSS
jgi:hypothetical protein